MSTAKCEGHKGILLFDLDGTLVDSAPDLAKALNRVLADAAAEPLDLPAVTAMVGDGVRKLVERGLAARDLALDLDRAVDRFLDIYEGALAVASRPYPGVPETLASLAADGWRMAVCTNKPEAASRRLLGALELDRHLAAIAGGDSYPVRKPDPRHLTLTLEELGLNGTPAIVVGDSRNDLLAAGAANLPVIWATYGYGGEAAAALPYTARLSQFADLPEILSDTAFPTR